MTFLGCRSCLPSWYAEIFRGAMYARAPSRSNFRVNAPLASLVISPPMWPTCGNCRRRKRTLPPVSPVFRASLARRLCSCLRCRLTPVTSPPCYRSAARVINRNVSVLSARCFRAIFLADLHDTIHECPNDVLSARTSEGLDDNPSMTMLNSMVVGGGTTAPSRGFASFA